MLLVCLMLPTLHSADLRIDNTFFDPRFVLIMLEFEAIFKKMILMCRRLTVWVITTTS